jgi:hypothetical protein
MCYAVLNYYVSFKVLFNCHDNISLCCEIVVTYHLMYHFVLARYYFMPEASYYDHFMCCLHCRVLLARDLILCAMMVFPMISCAFLASWQ